jgi:hypothetical protein
LGLRLGKVGSRKITLPVACALHAILPDIFGKFLDVDWFDHL